MIRHGKEHDEKTGRRAPGCAAAPASDFGLLDEVTARVSRSLSLRLAHVEARRSQQVEPGHATAAHLLARARSTLRWAAQDSEAGLKTRPLLEASLRRAA